MTADGNSDPRGAAGDRASAVTPAPPTRAATMAVTLKAQPAGAEAGLKK